MTIEFCCDKCGAMFESPDDWVGVPVECDACGKVVFVPSAAAAAKRKKAQRFDPARERPLKWRSTEFWGGIIVGVLVGACVGEWIGGEWKPTGGAANTIVHTRTGELRSSITGETVTFMHPGYDEP